MYEDKPLIWDFLPIRRNVNEDDYIKHLLITFSVLYGGKNEAKPFAAMPYHLLFMLVIQYKVLQITKTHKESTNLFFSVVGTRNKAELLSEQISVFDVALINEKMIPEIFQIIGVDGETIKMVKKLVGNRNDNFAHASGGIESNLDKRIEEYNSVMSVVQKGFTKINADLASIWLSEIKWEDEMSQFIETHMLGSYLNSQDLGEIINRLLESGKLSFEQWEQVVNKGLELNYDQTIFELKYIASSDKFDESKKYNADRILRENGEESPLLTLDDAQDWGLI